jgi:hypothetical protein
VAVKGKKDQFWEMREGGPYAIEEGTASEIFKCTGCGAETHPEQGWNGEPSRHNCRPGCPCRDSDWRIGNTSQYRKNFDRIYPDAPGAGM